MNIKKILLKVFSANFIQTVTNIVIGFVIPAILSIDDYSKLKTYTLYITYIGLLHLGFIDGLYLKYGGKDKKNLNLNLLKGEHNFLIIFQLIIIGMFLIISIISKDIIIFLFTISILPINLVNFHKQVAQAIGEFDKYTKVLNIYTISYTILNLVLILIFKVKSYIPYCIITIISNLIVICYYEFIFYKEYKEIKAEYDKDNIKKCIQSGFFIMIGNFIAIILYAIDKWFVKLFFSAYEFSYYSFAISMFNIINVLLNSICVTFYNVFSKNNNIEYIKKIKNNLLFIGALSSSIYFALSFIVNMFLKKYIPSLSVIAITFATFPYLFVIKAIYINLYKTQNIEKRYSKVVIIILIVATILNFLVILINKNILYISIATLISFIFWYFYSIRDFKFLKPKIKEILFLIFTTVSFVFLSHLNNIYISIIIYLIIIIVESKILLNINIKKFLK